MDWCEHLEVFEEWLQKTDVLYENHRRRSRQYAKYTDMLSYPTVVISTVIGTTSFSLISTDKPSKLEYGLQILFAIGNLSVAVLTGVLKYGGMSQLREQHAQVANEWSKLHRDIRLELSLPEASRQQCHMFCRQVQQRYDKLCVESPDLPDSIANVSGYMTSLPRLGKFQSSCDTHSPIVLQVDEETDPGPDLYHRPSIEWVPLSPSRKKQSVNENEHALGQSL